MFIDIIKTTVNEIMGQFESSASFEKFENYLNEHGWPISYPLPTFVKAINLIIEEKLPDDPEGALVDLLLGQTKTAVKTTKKQKAELQQMLEIAKTAKKQECAHDKMGIAPFMHGGGFTPMYAQPEAICLDCALNVTLYHPRSIKIFNEELGINTTKAEMKGLSDWAQTCMKNSRAEKCKIDFAEAITKDPIAAYNAAGYKWDKEIPFKITDRPKFESRSGQ